MGNEKGHCCADTQNDGTEISVQWITKFTSD